MAGEADNEPSENKKDLVPKEHLGSKHGTLGLAPDSEDRSLPPPDWQNANTQEGTPCVCPFDNTREAGLGVREVNPDRRNTYFRGKMLSAPLHGLGGAFFLL